MIATELLNDGTLIRHWSTAGQKIRQVETGDTYEDAIDVIPCRYTYEETDIPIEEEEIDDTEALAIITGGGA